MFQYQEKVNAGVPQLCTPEKWDELIDSLVVKDICARIAALDETAGDYAERKQALKKRLPIIIPHAASFKNGKRVSADAVPSGLAMLDVDHVEKPREWYNSLMEIASTEHLKKNGIYLIAITASGNERAMWCRGSMCCMKIGRDCSIRTKLRRRIVSGKTDEAYWHCQHMWKPPNTEVSPIQPLCNSSCSRSVQLMARSKGNGTRCTLVWRATCGTSATSMRRCCYGYCRDSGLARAREGRL